jgi:pre-mRNA-splicing factor CWC22
LLLFPPTLEPAQVGAYLQDVAPAGLHSVFERFRAILHEGAIDKRCQYMIEGLFAVRKVRGVEAACMF